MDWCLDLCYLGGRLFGWFSWNSYGTYFIEVFFYFLSKMKKKFFLLLFYFFTVLWWNFINVCSTFTHSFTQFFSCIGEV